MPAAAAVFESCGAVRFEGRSGVVETLATADRFRRELCDSVASSGGATALNREDVRVRLARGVVVLCREDRRLGVLWSSSMDISRGACRVGVSAAAVTFVAFCGAESRLLKLNAPGGAGVGGGPETAEVGDDGAGDVVPESVE